MKVVSWHVRGVLTVAFGLFALSSPQTATATPVSTGSCELCWHESTCAYGGGWTHCALVCPEFNGQVYCGIDEEECGGVGLVKLICGSASI